jgi:hypothetical protein
MGARTDRHTYVPGILDVICRPIELRVSCCPAPRSRGLRCHCPCDSLAQIPRFSRKSSGSTGVEFETKIRRGKLEARMRSHHDYGC